MIKIDAGSFDDFVVPVDFPIEIWNRLFPKTAMKKAVDRAVTGPFGSERQSVDNDGGPIELSETAQDQQQTCDRVHAGLRHKENVTVRPLGLREGLEDLLRA